MTVRAIKLLRPDARMHLAVLHSVRRLIQDRGVKGEGGLGRPPTPSPLTPRV